MQDDYNPTGRAPIDSVESQSAARPGFAGQAPPAGYPPAGYVPAGYVPVGYAAVPRRSGWFWAAIFFSIFGCIVVALCITLVSLAHSVGAGDSGSSSNKDSVAVIDISGVILDADKIDKQLQKFGDDDNVKAIVLHIDSPGGGAAASQEVYHEVMRIRSEKHKTIVASVESVGASGAYYIASACDRIYANPASVVGSIGVIMEWTNYGELMRWAKLKNVTISRGELKTAGDPSRDLTPAEQAYFQSLVDNMYSQFVHDVATGRHTTDDAIKPLATGQVWTGEQALGLHLIDQQGGFRTALMQTAKDAGISGEPKIVRPAKDKRGIWSALNDDADSLFPNPSKLLDHAPGFYFMWK